MRISNGRIFLLLIFLYSCALQRNPEGGAKDITPPEVISTSPENFATNFSGHDIELQFDEYIALNDIGNQLVISPLLTYAPEIKIRKKSILIHLKDTFLENTTYTFNFGDGIMDNNEGNKLSNYQFVFSTGPVIDSLTISGKVQHAFTGATEKGILAQLYHKTDDSIPMVERPVYFARTNDSGYFTIRNISPGEYKIIALQESDANYLYTPGNESIGYLDSAVAAGTEGLQMKLFREIPAVRFMRAYSEFPGKSVLIFNQPADTITWKYLNDSTALDLYAIHYSPKKDTVTLWYRNLSTDSLSLQFENTIEKDTVILRLFKRHEDKDEKKKFALALSSGLSKLAKQTVFMPFRIESNHPLVSVDTGSIVLLEDSSPVKPLIQFADSMHLQILVNYDWKEKTGYSLLIPKGSIRDIYGVTNDTTEFTFSTNSEADYGSVKISYLDEAADPYVVQLIDDAGNVYRQFESSKTKEITYNHLLPRVYRIKLFRDDNKNGIWDTGEYLKHKQPEEVVYYPEGITVRANWDVEITIRPKALTSKKP